MPTLYKAKKKSNKNRNKQRRSESYNSYIWRLLRDAYIKHYPLCQICQHNGKLTPAEDVHHKDSPFHYSDKAVIYDKLTDVDNLISVCKQCHSFLHRNGTTYGLNLEKEAEAIKKKYPEKY